MVTKPLAQSARVVEYTDCIFTEGKTPPPMSFFLYYNKLSDGELWNVEYTFIAIAPLPSLTWNCSTR